MKNLLCPSLLVTLLLLSAPAQAAPEAVGAKVYAGEGGLEVTVIQLKQPDRYLIQVMGSKGPCDGLVLPYTVDSTGLVYRTAWRGGSYSFFVGETWRGSTTYKLYVPDDLRVGHPVTFNEARTKLVKLGELLARHEKQVKDGTITRFGSFNRAAEQASTEADLAQKVRAMNEDCQTQIPSTIDWSGISDELIKSISISGYCDSSFDGLRRVCRSRVARAEVAARVKKVTCRFGKERKVELDAQGNLVWMTYKGAANGEEAVQRYLQELPVAGPYGAAAGKDGELPVWRQLKTLGDRMLLEEVTTCSDGKSAFVLITPGENGRHTFYYGDGKTFARIPRTDLFDQIYFLDPRQWNPEGNPSTRSGHDMRRYSSIAFDGDKKACVVRCGARKTELPSLDGKAAADLLRTAQFTGPLHKRAPHVLTRDDNGVYYYVDRGTTPETQNSFQLYVGPRGNLKLLAMTNVVADSQGEIFTTKNGALRFIVGPGGKESSWVKGKKVTKLTPIPVEQNLNVIYNDLGVYRGQRLGTPCDDL
jgi:hypothetical protein